MSFLVDTTYRTNEEEIMDDFSITGDVLDNTLDQLANINKWLGGNQVTLSGLKTMLKKHPKDEIITIVDLGCGGGDMLRLIADYGRKHGYIFKLIGIDANEYTVEHAKKRSQAYHEIQFLKQDIFSEEFNTLSYDIVIATLFLHHFKEDQILNLLRSILEKARIGVLINDLHRHRLAYYLFKLLSLTIKNKMVKEDGLVSILRGFKRIDLIQISKKLDVNSIIKWRWAFRFQWIIQK
ncbi:methyltransferase domain-containing protein [Flavobacteriaceae bacterium AU392]|nr:methyltransferase domain-containing protein [Flavobacteriaceae bacterium]RKM84776.1 methyltransferase domain-containing protein [Flavobacteriaceae bacterium AU392]